MASPAGENAYPKPVNQLNTAKDLQNKLDSLKRGRNMLESQWKLNMAFYRGRQYTYYNKSAKRLESLPTEDGEKPRYRVRLVSNQIISGSHSLLAKFTKTKPVISATPASGSDADVKAAMLSEKLLKYLWTELCMDDKLEEALLWSIITGQGYWKISWDEHAGKALKFLLGPDGQPITDEPLKDLFRAQLAQYGIPPQEKTVYLGDIKIEVPSPFDVYLDPQAKVLEDAKYMICDHYLTPEEIYTRWKHTVKADSISTEQDSFFPISNSLEKDEPDTKQVHSGYFLPTPALPNGRYVVWIDGKIVEDKAWQYPFTKLPLIKFPGLRVPGSIYDSSVVEQAIPLQKELNRTISQIVEYKNLTVKPRVWAPTGSLTGQRVTSEPGAIYEYNPIGDHKPEIEKLPSMPPYIFDHLTGIRNALRDVFGLTEVTEGKVPPNVEAGIAIDLLQEMATDRLAPTIKLIESSLGKAGQLILNFAQEYYKEPRLLKIQGSGGGSYVKRFTQADIQGGVSVHVETGSALPRSRAGRQARILDYIDKGIIRPDQGYKYLDLADLEGIASAFRADEDQALREHDKLIEGAPLNPQAMQRAQQEVMSGQAMGPDGQPIQDPETAEQYVKMAALSPQPFENYTAHLDTHALFMKSVEFESLPEDVQELFLMHFEQTQNALRSLPPQMEFKAVQPTLQIKATAGPTAVSDILQKAGVDVTPEEMLEPPLETWVSDSVDKPDTDMTGPGQEAMNLSEAAKIQLEAQAADAASKAQALRDQLSHESDLQKSQNDDSRAEEMHAASLRKAQADAALAEKKAAQSDFRPKPPSKGSNGKK